MNKKMKTIISILTFIVMISLSVAVLATGTTIDGVTVTPKTDDVDSITTLGDKITGVIKVVGVFAAVAILMIVGIRYMMGSAEEKAEYKKVMIPYVIGAILLFGAAVFAEKIAGIASGIF